MFTKRKYVHIINWNIITTIISLTTIVMTIIITSNQQQTSLLSSQLEILIRENSELKDKEDPAWQNKLNTQREYFESEIDFLKRDLIIAKENLDTLKNQGFMVDKDKVLFTKEFAERKIQEFGSAEIIWSYIELLEKRDSLTRYALSAGDSLIDIQNKLINSQKQRIYYSDKILNSQKLMEREIAELEKNKKILFSLGIIIVLLISSILHKRLWNKEY